MKGIFMKVSIFLLLLFMQASMLGAADFSFRLLSGYTPFGILRTEELTATQVIPLMVMVELESPQYPISVEVSGHFTPVFFDSHGLLYSGTFNAMGLALNAKTSFTRSIDLQIHGESLLFSSLALKTNVTSTVNGDTYEHSSVTTYSNSSLSPGFLARLALMSNGKNSANKYVRYGLTADLLFQNFNKKTSEAHSNLSDVESGELKSLTGNYTWSYVGLNAIVGYVF